MYSTGSLYTCIELCMFFINHNEENVNESKKEKKKESERERGGTNELADKERELERAIYLV